MKIQEIWTTVKEVEVLFIGQALLFTYKTNPCAQHCGSWFKANPSFIVNEFGSNWYC